MCVAVTVAMEIGHQEKERHRKQKTGERKRERQ